MDFSKARELREQRKKLVMDANALPIDTAEQRAVVNKMHDDADAMKQQIDLLERADAAEAEYRNAPANQAPPNGQPDGGDLSNPENLKRAQERHHIAWRNFMKYGMYPKVTQNGTKIFGISAEDRAILGNGTNLALGRNDQETIEAELRSMERRDMGTGGQGAYPSATTGFFVPVGFVDRIEEALKYYGPMMNGGAGMPEIFDTATGQVLPFPTDNDTTVTGELVGEGQQVSTGDVALSQILFGAYKYSSRLVKISIELLQDSAFALEPYLIKKFGIRLGRILNNHFTVGTGTSQPNGIVTASTLGVAAVGSALNDGSSASTNTIGSDDLVNLEHSVDPLYRGGAKWMFHDTTLRSLKNIKDKYGRPLWLPGLAVQAPDTILSYGYLINNDMAQLQTQATSPVVVNKTVLFGQLSKYLIRRVRDMSLIRLEERFADYGQVAFLMFMRMDGNLLDAGTHPVRYMTNSF